MNFNDKLKSVIQQNNSLLCIGLDSDWEKLPPNIKKEVYPQFTFNKEIIAATHDLVCAYKPNSAFYEFLGSEGIRQLKLTCDYLHENYPHIPVILDAKRADIGSTNRGYISYAFEYLRADAITLNPYLGREALQQFLDKKDKGCIILCRTSNPGAGEFQDLEIEGEPLYIKVAKNVINDWNANNNCLLVVGATYPDELKKIRESAPNLTFLVPGIGSQGGDIEATLKAGLNVNSHGLIVNASRSIIFAGKDENFAKKAREEAEKLKNEINQFRKS